MSMNGLRFAEELQQPDRYELRRQEQWQQAAERFAESEDERAALQMEVEEKGVLAAEDPARVVLRETLLAPGDGFALERVLGENDLMPVNYLSRGLVAARAVCRIHIRRSNGLPEGFGTGFMISPSLLLTNHHVLPTASFGTRSLAEFDFENDDNFMPKQTHLFQMLPDRFFYSNQALDFALIAVSPLSLHGVPIENFGFLPLTESSGKALASEWVSSIQHPSGSDKHIALRNNRVLNRYLNFIHYQTDTEPGSSGSPVFNDQWDVVALHHAGVPKRSRGRIMKKDGRVWHPGEPDDLIDWIANEGVRISSIFAHLEQKQDWSAQESRILEELGALSSSDLVESMILGPNGDRPVPVEMATLGPVADMAYTQALSDTVARPPITLSQLLAKLEAGDVTEEEVAAYFEIDHTAAAGIDPQFRINRDLVVFDTAELEESALLLNAANWISRRSRQRAYLDKRDDAAIRIVSEGDSWFQFPLLLHDVVDHLMDEPDLAVLSFGGAGDLVRDMAARAEFTPALASEMPALFLFSGGGNDLVAGGGLKRYLHRQVDSTDPRQLINRAALDTFKAQIAGDYVRLISAVLGAQPNIQILCHGYSYPVPNSGIWLGAPMNALGISNRQVQQELIRIIIDEVNDVLAETAARFPHAVHYLDVRNVVPAQGWFDELHPTSRFYGDVATVFLDKIRELA